MATIKIESPVEAEPFERAEESKKEESVKPEETDTQGEPARPNTKEIFSPPPRHGIKAEDLPDIKEQSPTSLPCSRQRRWACPQCIVTKTDAARYWNVLHYLNFQCFDVPEQLPARIGTPKLRHGDTPIEFESEYSYSEHSSEGSSIVLPETSDVGLIEIFRDDADEYHDAPWPPEFFRVDGAFAAFMNFGHVYECRNFMYISEGKFYRRRTMCGFSRVPYPGKTFKHFSEKTMANMEALQDLAVGIPNAILTADVNKHFHCLRCVVHMPDLERDPSRKAYVESEPRYRATIENPLRHVFPELPGPWRVFMNDLTLQDRPEGYENDPDFVPGVRCKNEFYGRDLDDPSDVACGHIPGMVIKYDFTSEYGVQTRFEPQYSGGLAFDSPRDKSPTLSDQFGSPPADIDLSTPIDIFPAEVSLRAIMKEMGYRSEEGEYYE